VMRMDRDALDTTTEHNQAETQQGVASTTRIGQLLKEGGDLAVHLNAAMQNKFVHTADVLAVWASASRLERAPRHAKPAAASAATPTPAMATAK